MASKRPKGLGRGLEALLGPQLDVLPALNSGATRVLPLTCLQPGKYQPRERMADGALAELAESIKAQGVIQPVLVRPLGHPGTGTVPRYEIIAGERRVRAAGLAGLESVPVVIRDVSDSAAAVMALIENIQREDLSPLEEARGLRRLIDEFGLTHDAAAQAVGRSRSAASNLLRLLNLSEPVQQLLLDGKLEMGHARALLPLDKGGQVRQAHVIVAKRLSVREAERIVARELNGSSGQRSPRRPASAPSREMARIEQRLSDHLAAPVRVIAAPARAGAGGGRISIAYASLDELNGLLGRLGYKDE
ncbi:MAG: ParB/RepB/Spo0J family partition protein [Pseudomonadota bacterium]|nr:ParB/RepB/Spo0J family partition protein [Pseudomonadota bacterium]